MPWDSKSIAAGEHFQNIILTSPITTLSKKTRNIFIQPTNVSGVTFEIEFIKLVLRKDYLSSIPTGLSWQGLSGIFQESVVMHTPEKLNIPITLSEHPELELNLGTVENYPVTFTVNLERKGTKSEIPLFEKTITMPQHWDRNRINLSRYAGESATLRLALTSEKRGRLEFGLL